MDVKGREESCGPGPCNRNLVLSQTDPNPLDTCAGCAANAPPKASHHTHYHFITLIPPPQPKRTRQPQSRRHHRSTMSAAGRVPRWIFPTLLPAVVLALFSPALRYDFAPLDDDVNILFNPQHGPLTVERMFGSL